VIADVGVVVWVVDVNGDDCDPHASTLRSRPLVLTSGSTDLLVAHLERRKRMRDRVSSEASSRVRALRGSRS